MFDPATFLMASTSWQHDCTPYWKGEAILYRAEDSTDGDGNTRITIRGFLIVGYTRCGAQIVGYGRRPKFVNLRAVKQFASGTKEEALRQLWYRKHRQIQILSHRLASAETAYSILDKAGYAPSRA